MKRGEEEMKSRFKNVREKLQFIEKLCDDNNQSIVEKLTILDSLSKDCNAEVRWTLASQLVLFDHPEIEKLLCNMLPDKNSLVRLEALDSLSIGRQPETIEKVKTMLTNEGKLIRAYAVLTLFDLLLNCYGDNETTFDIYREATAESLRQEHNPRVLLEYYHNQYLMGEGQGLQQLKELYEDAVEKQFYHLIWPLLHTFQEIQNEKNAGDIKEVLGYEMEKLLLVQRELVEEIIGEGFVS